MNDNLISHVEVTNSGSMPVEDGALPKSIALFQMYSFIIVCTFIGERKRLISIVKTKAER
jgi:hypothetical protein